MKIESQDVREEIIRKIRFAESLDSGSNVRAGYILACEQLLDILERIETKQQILDFTGGDS